MKSLLFIFLVLPSITFSAEFTSLLTKPNVLELKKYRTVTDSLEVKYIHDNPRVVVSIGAGSKEVATFLGKFVKSDLNKLNCDGDFSLTIDRFGSQFILVNSIKSCVDENGEVIAHSVGIAPLNNAQIAASTKFINDSLKALTALTDTKVNDSLKPKDVVVVTNPKAGVYSSKLDGDGVNK